MHCMHDGRIAPHIVQFATSGALAKVHRWQIMVCDGPGVESVGGGVVLLFLVCAKEKWYENVKKIMYWTSSVGGKKKGGAGGGEIENG